jgi:nitroreductase
MVNSVLKTIRNRRSTIRFKSTPVDAEKLNAVLEAGRWAPSWTNSQPWRFIVVKDEAIKEHISNAVSTFFNLSIKDAPMCIAVCVDPKEDPFHFVEDGTTASQNMALASQSLGLSTSWIGVFSLPNDKNSTERKLKKVLQVPEEWRLVSVLPLGVPEFNQDKKRKQLSEIVDSDRFVAREHRETEAEATEKLPEETPETGETTSVRDVERAIV